MEVASLVISIIALLASVIVVVYDKKVDRKLNNISMASTYFNDLYKDFLLKDIPQGRRQITFNYEGRLVGSDNLISTLKDIRTASAYFLYTDKVFYNKLKASLQGLEDYILDTENRILTGEEQTDVLNNISSKISNIYAIMTKKCPNG